MLSDPFIRRPIATSLVMIGVMLLGLVAYFHLPVASMPVVDLPTIVVRTGLPGASPETMAAAVATPLERQIGTIAGLTELTSINALGGSTIVAQFDVSRDVDGVARDVQAAINAAAATLPADLPAPPFYIKANPNIFPVITLSLASDIMPAAQVYDFADQIILQKISQIPGVSQVSISGADKTAVRVAVDPVRIGALGLDLEDVRAALSALSTLGPKGSFDGPEKSFSIAANDQLHDAAAFRGQIVAWKGSAPIRLGDIATVTDDVSNTKVGSWLDGKRAVLVEVRKRPGANTIEVVDRVHAALAELRPLLPPALDLRVVADRTKVLRAGIFDLQLTMLLSTALVVMVIALFLRRFWATVIPAATIPVAVCATFAVMYLLDYSLDNLSIMALIIAVGFIVDDTIVMVENVFRLMEQGASPLDAARRGARQIAFTVVSLTASLLAALIPILFMPGILGRFFQEFGVTLAVAILASAVISLTLTPTMCAHLLPPGGETAKGGRLGEAMERSLARLGDAYGRSLEAALSVPWTMLGIILVAMLLGLGLYGVVPKGFLPKQDTGVIRGITDAPPDISFDAMRARQGDVVRVIITDPAVASVSSSVGVGIFNALNNGSITVNLKPFGERDVSAQDVADRLRPKLARLVGIDTYLSPVDDFGVGGRAGRAAYQYTMLGPDLPRLTRQVERMREAMRALPEITDVSTDQAANGLTARITIDRDGAARLGVSVAAIDTALYNAFGQRQVANIYNEFDQAKVVIEVRADDRDDIDALDRLYVSADDGRQVPLSVVTSRDLGLLPVQINHMGQLLAITIGFNLAPDVALGTAMARIDETARDLRLPADITGLFAGDAKAASDAGSAQLWMLLGAIVAIYLVLGMLYESYAHPLTILSTIPSSGVGALLALLITGTEFSFIAAIALILLIGIVMKNAIMMVDFALVAERELGLAPREAIVHAARQRFRPITMTTMAAVFGALPLAIGVGIGSELRQPLGIAMVGGLIAAQFVTIYTTPVVYVAVDRLRGRRRPRLLPAA